MLGLPKFLKEKITLDIVRKLPSYEFRLLVIADSGDIMSLHVYCSKYTPQKLPSKSGALKFNIPKYMPESLLEEGFTVKEISATICVAERTVYRQINEYKLSKLSLKSKVVLI